MLQQDNQIEQNLPLRELYDKYLHPDILPLQDKEVWKRIQHGDVLDLFQLDSDVGRQAAKKIAPDGIFELSLANGLMRLAAAEKGAETPMEKYLRFKKEPGLWYDEMRRYGLTRDEVEAVRPYFEPSCGVPIDQECLMKMLMDSKICNFTLAEANTARKIISKKQTKRVNELKVQVQTRAKSANLGRYIWDCGIKPQASYSFSIIHSTLYSFIGFQTAYLATNWNPIYWNTACLIINSNSEEEEWDKEDEDDVKKAKSANYEKIARAIGVLTSKGINVSTIDINNSGYTFKPDAVNNRILYGLKPVTQVNEEQIDQIITGRPYVSFFDFMNRCPLKKPTMLSLIKGGAFDNLEREWAMELGIDPRILIMTIFCARACEPKKRLTLQNFNGLINQDLIPKNMVQYKYAFNFNKYLKAKRKVKDYYAFDDDCYNFYEQYFDIDKIEIIAGTPCIKVSVWAKLYDKFMGGARAWLKENQEEVLRELNIKLFLDYWDHYAEGNISFWEMSALCFYSHPHELADVDFNRYGIENFFSMPQQPEVDHYYKRNGRRLPIYKIKRIAGTVIGKNDTKASIALLTVDGVVNVKFTKEYYAMFKKQISEKDEVGDKHVKEKSWFKRGTKLMIQGYRKDDTFVSKTYFDTPGHQLYKITKVNKDSLVLTSERYKTEEEYV